MRRLKLSRQALASFCAGVELIDKIEITHYYAYLNLFLIMMEYATLVYT
jgi:hypothetical protein